MKRAILVILSLVLAAVLATGALAQDAGVVLKVGATPVPHAEILQLVKDDLAKEGIKLEIIEFNDYVQPNMALAAGELDANYFQHVPYLEEFSAARNLPLTYIAKIHIEPMGVYSKKVKKLSDLKKGAIIGIPNDPTNGGRALNILASAGLITLKPGVGIKATVFDIAKNPKGIVIKELEAAQLPRALPDVEAAVINGNYAIPAGLNPLKDALYLESSDSPYANVLAVRKSDVNNPALKKLAKALQSKKVKDYILKKYNGAVVATF